MPIGEKYCTKCRQYKPLKEFRPKGLTVYDYRCSVCRQIPVCAADLKHRLQKGLISDEAYVKEKLRRKESMLRGYTVGVKAARQRERTESWAPLQRSARITAMLLAAYSFSAEGKAWREEVYLLIADAKKALRRRRKKEFNKGMLFWYDVDSRIYYQLTMLIHNYPEGKENCPIQMM